MKPWHAVLALLCMTIGGGAGCSSDDDPIGTVTPPTANAGLPQESSPAEEVLLDGSGSVGDQLQYAWRQVSGESVVLADSAAVVTTFDAPGSFGMLSFELEVTDSRGNSDRDRTLVTVMAPGNNPPVAEAGADQRVGIGLPVQLAGSGSDPDGDPLTFAWRQYAGTPTVTFSPDGSVSSPTFTAPAAPTVLSFELSVDDGQGGVSRDSMMVSVEASPTPGLPTLWVLNVNQSRQNVAGWTLPTLPLPENSVEPDRLVQGAATELSLGATDLVIDAAGAALVCLAPFSEAPRINVYLAVPGTPNIAPARSVQGSSTLLEGPMALALQPDSDVLYVVDEDGILVFNGVSQSSFDGDVAPVRVMTLLSPRYDAVAASLGPDGALYVADRNVNGGSVWVYDNAATASGPTAPSRIISGSHTAKINDVYVDAGDRLYVCQDEPRRIHVWDNATSVTPDQAPDRSIFPDFTNARPGALAVGADNAGWLLDPSRQLILKYADIHTADQGTNSVGALTANALAGPRSIVIGR